MMKWIKRIIVSLFVIGILSTGTVVYLLETSIDKVLSKSQQDWLYSEIEKAPELPQNVYDVIDKYYPDFFEQGVWSSVISQVFGGDRDKCQCRDIYLPFIPGEPFKARSRIIFNQDALVMALELEERFSQKRCFEFNLSIQSFGTTQSGIEYASKYYYNKDLGELSEREVIALLITRKASYRFNPKVNNKALEKAIDRIMTRNDSK